jgi:predicted TIM-barrel fold metal-dependent hydrolase
VVIIPHLGLLNGGFGALMEAGVWESEMVWADTALAGEREIRGFIDRYGTDRLVFGSDYPFGLPGPQLTALRRMNLPEPELEKILSGNILRVLRRPDDAGA